MTVGWRFPISDGGQLSGYNDASMDHFKGDRAPSIVRETVQNSLDVRVDQNKPVVVAFSLDEIPAEELDEVTSLSESLKRSRAEAISQHGKSDRSTKFYDTALELVKRPSIKVLGIHDFNTTGLVGPTVTTKGTKPEAWLALVKGAGLSIKSKADSGGSFGHGSKAPIGASQLRTVFYYTEIENAGKTEIRFQGKSILQSHFNENDEQTQGTGYFGFMDNAASPLIDDDVPEWAQRLRSNIASATGTSIFVPFANLHDDDVEVWKIMKLAVLANFYYAILMKSLVVQFGNGEELHHENVAEELRTALAIHDEELKRNSSKNSIFAGLAVARIILNPTEEGTIESKSFGKISWFIRTGDEVNSRMVALSRNGMLITTEAKDLTYRSFGSCKPFELFVSVDGVGSSILKSLENPAHDNIQFDRIDDNTERKDVEKKYKVFVKELKELVLKHAAQEVLEETFISDLDDLFGGTRIDPSLLDKGQMSNQLVIGKIKRKKMIEGAETELPDPDLEGNGRGRSGGENEHETTGGNIHDPDGDSNTQGVKLTGRQVRDFRVVRHSVSDNLITIFFTPVVAGDFRFAICRSGETFTEAIQFRLDGSDEWVTSIQLKALNLKNRFSIKAEIRPDDFNFALEGVMTRAN